MDSLSSGPVAEVLQRLHQEAEAADAPLAQSHASEATSHEQMITQFIDAETKDLEGVYHGLAGNFLNVSPEFGRFLYMCARSCKAGASSSSAPRWEFPPSIWRLRCVTWVAAI